MTPETPRLQLHLYRVKPIENNEDGDRFYLPFRSNEKYLLIGEVAESCCGEAAFVELGSGKVVVGRMRLLITEEEWRQWLKEQTEGR